MPPVNKRWVVEKPWPRFPTKPVIDKAAQRQLKGKKARKQPKYGGYSADTRVSYGGKVTSSTFPKKVLLRKTSRLSARK